VLSALTLAALAGVPWRRPAVVWRRLVLDWFACSLVVWALSWQRRPRRQRRHACLWLYVAACGCLFPGGASRVRRSVENACPSKFPFHHQPPILFNHLFAVVWWFSASFVWFLLFSSIFGYFRMFPAILVYFASIFVYFQLVSSSFWEVFGYVRVFSSIFVYFRLFSAILVYFRLFSSIFG